MAADIGQIAQLLDATLDPTEHRKAENALKQEAAKSQYSLSLLNIVNSDTLPLKTRLAAALAFKNFIRTSYVDEEGNYKLPQDEVQVIKERLIGLMISSPANIQAQLGDAISVIADSDFWRRWDTLTQVGYRPPSMQPFIMCADLLCRSLSADFPPPIPRSTLVFSKLHTPSSPDGDPCSAQMSSTWRSTM
jgi:hypothetical protein